MSRCSGVGFRGPHERTNDDVKAFAHFLETGTNGNDNLFYHIL
jgi:hypothetical protein